MVNRGFSGYNSSQALQALPQIFTPATEGGPRIKYLVVLFGANDACVPVPVEYPQHVPLDEFRRNLAAIITHPTIASHRPKILLVTPPPLDGIYIAKLDAAAGQPIATRQSKVSAAYTQAVREVAAEHAGADVTLIDLYKAIMDRAVAKTPGFDPIKCKPLGDPECGLRGYLEHLLPDGLHMSGESYQVFFDLVKGHIGAEWAGTDEEDRVGYVLPEWRYAPWLGK